MNKYKVKVSHLFSEIFDVEAENEEKAKQQVKTDLEKEDRKPVPQYEVTLPIEHWPVITAEKYNEIIQEELNKQIEESNIITP